MKKKRHWAAWELRYLQDSWPDKSDREIALYLNRSVTAVKVARYHHGIKLDPADWTSEEDAHILGNWSVKSDEELGADLGRTPNAIYQRGLSLGLARRRVSGRREWTAEEESYLAENWGTVAVGTMCKTLNRSLESILNKKNKLGLGAFLESGDYVTFNQLLCAMGGKATYNYKTVSWVKNRGLPIHTKLINEKRVKVVYLGEFWAWAEKNRTFLDFSKMEPLALGKEPAWVAQQRRIDIVSFANQRKDPWTPQDDQRLTHYVKQRKYTYAEMSRELRRSVGAIQRRCIDLGLKERPVRESQHNPWSDEHLQLMATMIRQGCSYAMIGEACGGRSEKAVRGVVFQKYQTESADKVRVMLGDGPWGTGAPEPTVKSRKYNAEVKKPMARLCGLLLALRNSMEFGEYWQKDMCQLWDDVKGCTAGCTNCDSCTEFQRIRPQYCARCGSTFFERAENRFCQSCRLARKKQAQRKWRRDNDYSGRDRGDTAWS